ncbi:MAG: L-histidine N(alpha)-methyltransferase [bacterium]
MTVSAERTREYDLPLTNCLDAGFGPSMAEDVKEGLSRKQKTLPCKYFYDERGSRLFEDICRLPEYYVTRAEMSILERDAAELMEGLYDLDLVEIGSGTNWKIKLLFAAAGKRQRKTMRYVPMDVCEQELMEAARDLRESFPELSIHGVVGDFTCHLHRVPDERKRKFAFFGSTIGNFSEHESQGFLSHLAGSMNPDDSFLLGFDMVKQVETMERAYNDGKGVTAAFNKNILRVVNSGLGADFDPAGFRHLAFYNAEEQSMEMHLQAERDMVVHVRELGMSFSFEEGETIHTEVCRKFTPERIENMVLESGFTIDRWFEADEEAFSLLRLKPAG